MGAMSNVGVKEGGTLGGLVRENAESIEPGLRIIDSRVLLGHATIDMAGLDSRGSLVLIALDVTADDGLLLRVLEACSWYAEYPDTVRRLYPTAQIRSGEAPRAIIIAERLPDSFLRKIRQLGLSSIDCLEFRHLQVNGATAVHFYQVERVRRTSASEQPSETGARRAEVPAARPEAIQATAPVLPLVHPAGNGKPAQPEPQVAEAPAVTPMADSLKQRRNDWEEFLSQLGAALSDETSARRAEAPVAQPESIEKPEIIQATAPAAPGAHPAGNGKPAQPAVEVPEMIAVTSVADDLDAQREAWQELLSQLVAAPSGETSARRAEAPVAQPEVPVAHPEIIEKPEVIQAAAPAAPGAHPAGNGKPAQPEPQVAETAPAASAGDTLDAQREEWQEMLTRLGTLHLPKNGALSREWREFLTQLLGAQ